MNSDETFGDDEKPIADGQHFKMVVPQRVGSAAAMTKLGEAKPFVCPVPMPFLDEATGEIENAAEYGAMPLRTILDLRELLFADFYAGEKR